MLKCVAEKWCQVGHSQSRLFRGRALAFDGPGRSQLEAWRRITRADELKARILSGIGSLQITYRGALDDNFIEVGKLRVLMEGLQLLGERLGFCNVLSDEVADYLHAWLSSFGPSSLHNGRPERYDEVRKWIAIEEGE